MNAKIMVQGLRVAPWIVEARLVDAGFRAEVLFRERPNPMGHLVVASLHDWCGQDASQALSLDLSEAAMRLQHVIEYLSRHCYGLQIVCADAEAVDVTDQVTTLTSRLGEMLPCYLRHGSVMIFVERPDQKRPTPWKETDKLPF